MRFTYNRRSEPRCPQASSIFPRPGAVAGERARLRGDLRPPRDQLPALAGQRPRQARRLSLKSGLIDPQGDRGLADPSQAQEDLVRTYVILEAMMGRLPWVMAGRARGCGRVSGYRG